MGDIDQAFVEFNEKVACEFDKFKGNFLSREYYPGSDSFIANFELGVGMLQYKINFQAEQLKNQLETDKLGKDSNQARTIDSQKAELLIRLQTLSSLITCHVINRLK